MSRRCGSEVVDFIASDVIDERGETLPDLLVLDAMSPGVSGLSIERGLHALGLEADVVLSCNAPLRAQPRLRLARETPNTTLTVPGDLVRQVERVARARGPGALAAS